MGYKGLVVQVVVTLACFLGLAVPMAVLATPVPYTFEYSSQYFGESATYTISLKLPKDLKIGYVGVSFANSYVDFSGATLGVSGISGGTPLIDYETGISGNHDLQYRLKNVTTLADDTWVTLTVTGAKNPPGPNGSIGWDYIMISDSTATNHDAVWTYNQANGTVWSLPSNHYVYLKDANTPPPAAPTPTPTPTPAPTPTVVYGCTDSKATNYNSNATNDNGTCTYPKPAPAPTVIYGCTDSKATNYNFSATHDDGSCIFPKPASQPSSNIVYGCTDRSATNFNSSATHGDGSCLFSTNQKEASAQPSIVNNTVVNIQQTAIISITQIQMNHLYYLPESKTTNLKQVNPARVNNFALDRVGMMSFIFLGQTNLSTKSAVDTFQRLDDVVHMDSYYFWFEWRFWILFKKDVNCTFYDSAKLLTANSPVTINGKTLNKNEYKVEVLKDGEKSVTIKADTVTQYVKEGERIEIAMKPSLTTNLIPDQSVTTDVQKFVLMGTSTDPNANIFVAFHGEKIELAVNKDGTFQKTFMLEEGVNEMRVSAYRAANTEPFATVRGMIELEQKREKLALWIKLVIGGVAALLATIAAIWFWKLRKRKRS